MRHLNLLAMLTLPVLVGCSGTERTHPASEAELRSGFEGYLYYQVRQFKQTVATTRYIEKGVVIGRAGVAGSGGCEPITTAKYVTAADYSRPWIMAYMPGLLEAYKFGVAWGDDGALKSANVDSTPDQGKTLMNLASAAASAAKITGGAAPEFGEPRRGQVQRACNDGETVISSELVAWSP